jgi:sugar lactone lactonase YvrE
MKINAQKMFKKNFLLFFAFCFYSTTAQTVTTLAGAGLADFEDGIGTAARFQYPYNATVDSDGTIFVTDSNNSRIRKITNNGEVTTVAGSGIGYADGLGATAKFYAPCGIVKDASGTLFVADRNNHLIRKITSEGQVSTFAGSTAGSLDGSGTLAKFNAPAGVAIASDGTLFVADSNNNRIRKITSLGVVTTIAGSTVGYSDGSGSTAKFNYPTGVAVDSYGTVYVTDSGNNCIRKITSDGVVTTVAGNGFRGVADGRGIAAQFNSPIGLAVDTVGNILVADTNNHRIRIINTTGEVTTLAGSTSGYQDGTASAAKFYSPYGLTLDTNGDLVIVDSGNHRIRKITSPLRNSEYQFENKISLYPNPFLSIINIELSDFTPANASICDSNGRALLTKKIITNKTSIDLSNLENGVYLIKISSATGAVSRKIIKH